MLPPPDHQFSAAEPAFQPPPRALFPTLRSDDGRVELTDTALMVHGQRFLWLELEGAQVQRVRWLLWFLVGGITLAGFLLGFLQNWLHTMPAVLGIVAGALLLLLGQRGTNRLRLHRLGREDAHFALPGELPPWQQLVAEANRRIRRRHDEAAAEAAALLAAQAAARLEPPHFE